MYDLTQEHGNQWETQVLVDTAAQLGIATPAHTDSLSDLLDAMAPFANITTLRLGGRQICFADMARFQVFRRLKRLTISFNGARDDGSHYGGAGTKSQLTDSIRSLECLEHLDLGAKRPGRTTMPWCFFFWFKIFFILTFCNSSLSEESGPLSIISDSLRFFDISRAEKGGWISQVLCPQLRRFTCLGNHPFGNGVMHQPTTGNVQMERLPSQGLSIPVAGNEVSRSRLLVCL